VRLPPGDAKRAVEGEREPAHDREVEPSPHHDPGAAKRPLAGAVHAALDAVPGAHASGDERHIRLTVGPACDLSAVLRAAESAGPLLRFDYQPPSLEEMFREAITR